VFGWIFLALALLIVATFLLVYWVHVSFALVIGPPAGAAMMWLCTWVAAVACGQTRQLRSSWIAVVSAISVEFAAILIWPSWGTDLGMTTFLALMALGAPTSLVVFALDKLVGRWIPSGSADIFFAIMFVSLAYLQAFVLLPRLFRKRAGAAQEPPGEVRA
jgi:hypothetical protein